MNTFSSAKFRKRYFTLLVVLGTSISILILANIKTMQAQKKISIIMSQTVRQRVLSQNINTNFFKLIETRNAELKKEYLQLLLKSFDELSNNHLAYNHYNTKYLELTRRISEIENILEKADRTFHELQFRKDELVKSGKNNFIRVVHESEFVKGFLKTESEYLNLMDRLLEEYIIENNKNLDFQSKLEWAGYIITIVVFIIMIFFIYNPIQKKLINTYQELWKANARLKSQNDDLELYRLMIEKSADPVFLMDIDDGFRMIFINESAVKHFGKPREEILTWSLPDWDPNFKKENLSEHYNKIRNRKSIVIETSHKSASGIIPVEVSANLIKYRDHLCHFGYFKDITNRKKAEEELVRAKEEAEIANRAKSDFLSSMSHEIRTPMNAVLGLTHLLKNSRLDFRQQDYLEKIEGAGRSLLGIINDILDISKVEAGKLEIEDEPFLLSEIIKNLSAIFSVLAGEKNIEILFDIDNKMQDNYLGDPLRISQVLINMLNNAVKFTDKGEVIFKMSAENKFDGIVTLHAEIRDTGIGMSPEQVKKLFNPFQQADHSISRRFGGTGLGLFITKKLIELMGGEIQVKSQLGTGTSIYLFIPLKKQIPEKKLCREIPADMKNIRILYVDDNREAGRIMENIFKNCGWQWQLAESAEQALDMIRHTQNISGFNLVLIEYNLPRKNGIELAYEIQDYYKNFAEENKKILPLILLVSNYSNTDLWDKADKAGIRGILTKPLTSVNFLEHIIPMITGENQPGKEVVVDNPFKDKLAGRKILAVEDNSLNREILVGLIHEFGASIFITETAEEALDKITHEKYDIVLMDIQMPGMDGYEACRRIKRIPSVRNIPVLALTANVMPDDLEKCKSAGMVDSIAKPVDINDLFEKIKKWSGVSL